MTCFRSTPSSGNHLAREADKGMSALVLGLGWYLAVFHTELCYLATGVAAHLVSLAGRGVGVFVLGFRLFVFAFFFLFRLSM